MRLLLLLLPLGLFAEDTKYEANLNCEIVGIEISRISEGKYESYSHYSDGFKVGDKLSLYANYSQITLADKDYARFTLGSTKDGGLDPYTV